MIESFEKVKQHAQDAKKRGPRDQSLTLKSLTPRQRSLLNFFTKHDQITSHDVAKLFKISPRTARAWCLELVNDKFLIVAQSAKKIRSYKLASAFTHLLK